MRKRSRSWIFAGIVAGILIIACGMPTNDEEEDVNDVGADIEMTAATTEFEPSPLYEEGEYTSVEITVVNNSDQSISINPLDFYIIDSDDTRHSPELGVDANQLDTLELGPGENVSGVITGEGDFEPAYVSFEPLDEDPVQAEVQ